MSEFCPPLFESVLLTLLDTTTVLESKAVVNDTIACRGQKKTAVRVNSVSRECDCCIEIHETCVQHNLYVTFPFPISCSCFYQFIVVSRNYNSESQVIRKKPPVVQKLCTHSMFTS